MAVAAAWLAAGGVGWIALRRVEAGLPIGPWSAAVLGTSAMVVCLRREPRVGALGSRPVGHRQRAGRRHRACVRPGCPRRADLTTPRRPGEPPAHGHAHPRCVATCRTGRRAALDGDRSGARPLSVDPGSGLRVSGTVRIALGRPELMLMSCTLVDSAPGSTPCEIALPAGASALWVSGDAGSRGRPSGWRCPWSSPAIPRCVACGRNAPWSPRRARSLSSAGVPGRKAPGSGRPAATRSPGRRRSTSVVPLRIRQGSALAPSLAVGGMADRRDLGPGEVWDLDVPRRADGVAVVTIATAAAFRPSDVDASSTDTRLLGAWVEPR